MLYTFTPDNPGVDRRPGDTCHAVIASVFASGRANLSVLHAHGTWGPRTSVAYDATGQKHDTWRFVEDAKK